jgi:urease accessory protein
MVIRARDVDPAKIVGRVVLDHDNRYRRRLVLQTDGDESLLLDLAEATLLRHGDGLALDDGAVILVEAMSERLLEIRAPQRSLLTRIVWHLGNRHVPTQLDGDRVRIREDHVIAEMVAQLGGTTALITAPFNPEGGAYGGAATHDHAPHEPHPVKDHSHAAG